MKRVHETAAAPPRHPKSTGSKASGLPPIPGLSEAAGDPNSDRTIMSSSEVLELKRLYLQEPTIRACVRILESAVLASGIQLTRNGIPVELKPSFERHLSNYWLVFARDVLASVLVTGVVPVILGKKPPPAFGISPKPNEDKNLVPLVTDWSVTQVVMERVEMVHRYHLETSQGDEIERSHVFIKSAPNRFGVPDSAMVALREPLLFIQALNAHALDAEKVRSRLLITTQLVPKNSKENPNIDTDRLFFDQESRQLADENEQAESTKNHNHLVLASKLAQQLNNIQTVRGGMGASGSGPPADGKLLSATEPSPVPPALFVAPAGQVFASPNT